MTMQARLPTHLWVMAVVRRANAEGRPTVVARKGERMGGGVLVKLNFLDGRFKVLVQQRDLDGRLGWMTALKEEAVTEEEAEAYIARSTARDPDLWVVEVEDRAGTNPFAAGPEGVA